MVWELLSNRKTNHDPAVESTTQWVVSLNWNFGKANSNLQLADLQLEGFILFTDFLMKRIGLRCHLKSKVNYRTIIEKQKLNCYIWPKLIEIWYQKVCHVLIRIFRINMYESILNWSTEGFHLVTQWRGRKMNLSLSFRPYQNVHSACDKSTDFNLRVSNWVPNFETKTGELILGPFVIRTPYDAV